MARIETDPNYSSPTFSRATASTDLFKKEDVQQVAAALSTHDHSTGKGLLIPFATTIPNGSITSAMIADATIDTADLKDGAVTSAKILDGTIATGDLAAGAVTNAKLAADTARANLLTNGSFDVWQRGNGPFTANGAYTADRWYISLAGSSTLSVSRDTSNVDASSLASAALTYTHNAASQLFQKLEDFTQLRNRPLTLSMRVRTATANAVRLVMWDNVVGYTYSAYHSGGGAFETLSLTRTFGATVTFLAIGVDLSASSTAYLDNAMLVVGSVAADYAPLHPADDLARCLRYYETLGGTNSEILSIGWCVSTAAVISTVRTKVRKAVSPTVTVQGSWSGQYGPGTLVAFSGGLSTSVPTLDGATVQGNGAAGFGVGQAAAIVSGTNSLVIFEANP